MSTSPEASCETCFGACCVGPQLMQLDVFEKTRLEAVGSILQTVADPVAYDRDDVIYPVSMQIHNDRGTISWLAERGREYEPLPANYGRYMLFGACGNLKSNEQGGQYCGIYESRPKVCRDFEEGGPTCQLMRAVKVSISPRVR